MPRILRDFEGGHKVTCEDVLSPPLRDYHPQLECLSVSMGNTLPNRSETPPLRFLMCIERQFGGATGAATINYPSQLERCLLLPEQISRPTRNGPLFVSGQISRPIRKEPASVAAII
jgi:hypothetical protein